MTGKVHAPDDDALATVRYGDLRELDQQCTDLRASLQDAKADLVKIAKALKVQPPEQVTAHDLVTLMILPTIATLMMMKGQVDAYEAQLRAGVESGALEGDGSGARGMALVGRRLDPEVLERAEAKRERAARKAGRRAGRRGGRR